MHRRGKIEGESHTGRRASAPNPRPAQTSNDIADIVAQEARLRRIESSPFPGESRPNRIVDVDEDTYLEVHEIGGGPETTDDDIRADFHRHYPSVRQALDHTIAAAHSSFSATSGGTIEERILNFNRQQALKHKRELARQQKHSEKAENARKNQKQQQKVESLAKKSQKQFFNSHLGGQIAAASKAGKTESTALSQKEEEPDEEVTPFNLDSIEPQAWMDALKVFKKISVNEDGKIEGEHSLSEDTKTFLSSILDSFKELVAQGVDLHHKVALPSSIQKVVDFVSEYLGKAYHFATGSMSGKLLTGLCLIVLGLAASEKARTLAFAIVSAGIFTLSSVVPKWDYITDHIKRLSEQLVSTFSSKAPAQEEYETQSFSSGFLADLSSFAGLATVFHLGPKFEDENQLRKWTSEVAKFPSLTSSLHKMSESFLLCIQAILDNISGWLGVRKLELITITTTEVQSYLEEVGEKLTAQLGHLDVTPSNRGQIQSLIKRGRELEANVSRGSASDKALCVRRLEEANRRLSEVLVRLTRAGIDAGAARWEPFGIMFVGAPGVGKTTSMTRFNQLMAAYIIGDNPEKIMELCLQPGKFIYNRVPEEEFFTNYNNQNIFVFDDFNQMVDVPGCSSNVYLEAFRSINTNSWNLHMADIAEKGTKVFSSDMVVATSNTIDFGSSIKSIRSPEALMRRFDTFLCCPKLEFCVDYDARKKTHIPLSSRRLNMNAFFAMSEEDRHNMAHLEYHRWNPLVGGEESKAKLDSKSYTFDELITYSRARLDEKKGKGKKMNTDHALATLNRTALDNKWSESKIKEYRQRLLSSMKVEEVVPIVPPPSMPASDLFPIEKFSPSHQNLGKIIYENFLRDYGGSFSPEELLEFLRESEYLKTRADGLVKFEEDGDGVEFIDSIEYDFKDFLEVTLTGVAQEFGARNCPKGFFDSIKKGIDRIKNVLPDCVSGKVAEIQSKKKVIGAVLSSAALLGAVYWFFTGEQLMTQSETNSKKSSSGRIKSTRVKVQRPRNMIDVEVQGTITEKVMDQCLSDFRSNVVWVTLASPINGQIIFQGHILFVASRLGVMPLHYADTWEYAEQKLFKPLNKKLILKFARVGAPGSTREICLDDLEFTREGSDDGEVLEDFVFVEVSEKIDRFKDIIKHFISESDAKTLERGVNSVFMTTRGTDVLVTSVGKALPIATPYCEYRIDQGWKYNFPSRDGDCGAVLFQDNAASQNGNIIGMHVAGSPQNGVGISVCLTRERILEHIERNNIKIISDPPRKMMEGKPDIAAQANINVYYGCQARLNLPTHTSIEPSVIADFGGPSTNKPAHLKPFKNAQGDCIDPLFIARSKYGGASKYIYQPGLSWVSAHYCTHILGCALEDSFSDARTVFSFEHACEGYKGVPFADGIDRSTSSGYPWCTQNKGTGKQRFLGSEGEYDYSSKDCAILRAATEDIIAKAKKGERSEVYYADFPKDERRSIAKVDAGKTRLISGSPLHYNIALRMYCADFIRWFMTNNVENGSAIGVNVWGSDWTRVAKHLNFSTSCNRRVIAGDFSNFDGSLTRPFVTEVLKGINRYYASGDSKTLVEDNLVRQVLFEDIMNSRHVTGRSVYEVYGGMPSGNVLTSIINTYVNNLLLRYAILVIVLGDPSLYDWSYENAKQYLEAIDREVHIICYGDDNVITVGTFFEDIVTQQSLTMAFAIMGFTYTSDTKASGSDLLYRKYTEVTFLKRHFVNEGGNYVAPLLTEVVYDMLRWTKRGTRSIEITKSNVDAALREAVLHSRPFYESFSEALQAHCMRVMDYSFTIEPFDELRKQVTSGKKLAGGAPG